MEYIKLQNYLIKEYRIVHNPESSCWKRTHAHVDGSRKICKHQIKESYDSLFLLLHEIGHIETDVKGMKRCEMESEATTWCINQMKQLGLPIKRKQILKYKKYIRMTYERGMRRGLTKRIKTKLYM